MPSDPKERLKGEVRAFLDEFEQTEMEENDMKVILPVWKEEIMQRAFELGEPTHSVIKTFIEVCEDYALCRGMLERVRQEAEEVRLFLAL